MIYLLTIRGIRLINLWFCFIYRLISSFKCIWFFCSSLKSWNHEIIILYLFCVESQEIIKTIYLYKTKINSFGLLNRIDCSILFALLCASFNITSPVFFWLIQTGQSLETKRKYSVFRTKLVYLYSELENMAWLSIWKNVKKMTLVDRAQSKQKIVMAYQELIDWDGNWERDE